MKPVKIAHYGDLHLGASLQYGHTDPATGMNTRELDYNKIHDFIVDTAIREKVDVVIFPGDAFKHRNPSMTQQREFAKRIKKLTDAGIPVLLVVGNHDLCNDPNKATSLEIFDVLGDNNLVRVSRRAELVEIAGLQVITLPWFNRSSALTNEKYEGLSKDKINEDLGEIAAEIFGTLLAKADPKKPLIAAVHATVSGAKFGAERNVMLGQDVVIPYTIFTDPKVSYVALAHIHQHQTVGEDYIVYSGSPERIDFGEAEEKKGFIIANIEAGKRAEWEFVETPARDFVRLEIDAATREKIAWEEVSNKKKGAVVKAVVSGKKSDVEKFDFVNLEKTIKTAAPHWYAIVKDVQKEDRAQSSEHFAEMDPVEILEKYAESKDIKGKRKEQMIKIGSDIIKSIEKSAEARGHGGFVPLRLSLKNFASHENSVLDFSEFSLAVLSGENGAGKSSLIESLAWCIWGQSRSKSDDSLVRLGTDDMEVSLDFSLGEEVHRIIRKRSIRSGRGSTVLELQGKEGERWCALSGDTIKDTQQKIIDLIGMSYEVFCHSVYLRQGHSGDFTEAGPTQRKDVLAEVLSLGLWGDAEEEAKRMKKGLEGQKLIFEGKRQQFEEEISKEEEYKAELVEAEKAAAEAEEHYKEKRKSVEDLESAAKDIVTTKTRRDVYMNSLKRIEERLSQIKEENAQLDQVQESAQETLQNSAKIHDAVAKERAIEKEIDQLQKIQQRSLEQKQKKAEYDLTRQTAMQKKESLEKDIARLEEEKKEISQKGKALKEKLEAGEDCPLCGAEKNHQKKSPHIDLSKEIEEFRAKFSQKVSQQNALLQEIDAIEIPEEQEFEIPVFSENMLTDKKNALFEIRKLSQQLPQLESAQDRIKESEERKAKILGEELKLIAEKDDEQKKLDALPEIDESKLQELERMKEEESSLEQSKNNKMGMVSVCRHKLNKIEEQKESLKKLEEENKETIEECTVIEDLVNAFGKKGVQTMVIESVLPEIEESTNVILDRISNGKMSIRLSTVREKKSATKAEKENGGTQIETLDIYVCDDAGEREYELFSGGEAFRVNFALRVALSKILARRAGTRIKFLLIDEGFGALDEEGRSAFISAVQAVSDDFEKVIAITHIEEIKDAFDTKIIVEKLDQKSKISLL